MLGTSSPAPDSGRADHLWYISKHIYKVHVEQPRPIVGIRNNSDMPPPAPAAPQEQHEFSEARKL